MLALQLCVFDDNTDSKSKLVKKYGCVVRIICEYICDALLWHDLFNDISECVMP